MDEYLTLREVAEKLGFRNHSTLRNAARLGRLRTIRKGVQHFTTQGWLDEYLAGLRAGNYKRGQARTDSDAHAAQSTGNGAE